MAQKLISISRPTKIEFIRLKRRLSLTERVQKILKDRLSILTMEFLQTARETVEAKKRLLDEFPAFYRALSVAAGYHGYIALEKDLIAAEGDIKVATGSRNVAGVKVLSIELEGTDETAMKQYNLTDTSSLVDRGVQLSERCLESIVNLAESQRILELLGMEIKKARRVSSALEYILIPGLQATIKYLYMKFEERDREEKSRLKRVKVLLQRG